LFKLRVHSQRGDLDLEVVVEGDTAIIGRSSDCHVVIDRPDISRRHAELRRGLVVDDLGSRNGTHVDGARIERATAVPRGRFQVGDAASLNQIIIEVLGEEGDPSRPAAPVPAATGMDSTQEIQRSPAPKPGQPAAAAADAPSILLLRAELAAEAERYRYQCARLEVELEELKRQLASLGSDAAARRALEEQQADNLRLRERIAELERKSL
jgi:hypothetical protein